MILRKFSPLLLLISALPFVQALAQNSESHGRVASDFFISASVEIASGLPEISRLDMIDYFSHGSDVKSENRLGRNVALKTMSDDMISWRDDDSVTTSIAVVPEIRSSRPDTMLVVIRTINLPVPDSEVSYYTSDWQPLSGRSLPAPRLYDWIISSDSRLRSDVEEQLPFFISSAEYDPEARELIFSNRMDGYFDDKNAPDILKSLRQSLKYKWDGRSFKLVE